MAARPATPPMTAPRPADAPGPGRMSWTIGAVNAEAGHAAAPVRLDAVPSSTGPKDTVAPDVTAGQLVSAP